ncbi:hypothetical protein [Pseudomonas sp. NMI795_08]|uniref:hypothetical protein n=1 Tax=Pseudomonas sp. NMI795_08 TaxID=2903144 RepID=UPI001E65E1D4|nr:hypothetical protein [Pseudomonas sp. NMI795_08]MCE1119132.1 hypothetical protein [Pseudomonas sp. NMI795_08]
MSKQTVTMLELAPDKWGGDMAPLDQVPTFARGALRTIQRNDVWEWLEASPMTQDQQRYLRWVLGSLSLAKVVERRLTWRERITGRLQR